MIILGSVIASAAIIVLVYIMSRHIKKRDKGRVATKGTKNEHYPKFVVTSQDPYEQTNIWDEDDLIPFDDNQKLYEPTSPGFGTTYETMYVEDGTKTYMFSFPIEEVITWGDTEIVFSDPYTFGDTTK